MSARGTSLVGACVAWVLAFVPFTIAEPALAGVSRLALAALPWIAYAGIPRPSERADRGFKSVARELAFETALFVPPLALGAWIDVALGMTHAAAASFAALIVGVCLALGAAARVAARSERGNLVFRIVWFAAILVAPILAGALTLGGAPRFGAAPPWLSFAASASPIGWIVACLRTSDAAPEFPWATAIVVLASLAIGFVARGRAEEENA